MGLKGFQPGNKLGKGRPKGETLKEWVRRQLLLMDDKERKEFLKKIPNLDVWMMGEGRPTGEDKISQTLKVEIDIETKEKIKKALENL